MREAGFPALLVFAVSIAVSIGACVKRDRLPITADPGDLIVVAVADESNRIVEARGFLAGAEAPRLSERSGERTYSFVVPRAQILSPSGEPVPQDMLDGLAVMFGTSGGRTEVGACGRCILPGGAAPLVVYSGDRCPFPAFAAGFDHAAGAASSPSLAAVRAGVELAWPGDCACPPLPTAGPPMDATFAIEAPDPAFEPIDAAAASSSGDVGVFSEHLAGWLGSNGRQATKSGAASPFAGPVLGAAWGSGGFFVASHKAGAGTRDARLDVFGPDLSIRASIDAFPIRPTRLLSFGPEDLVMAVGTSIARNPKVLLCAGALGTPPAAPMCAELNPDGILPAGDNLLDAAEGPDGTIVAVGRFGFILFGSLFDPRNLLSVHTDRNDASEANGTLEVSGRPPIRWRAIPGVFQDAGGVRIDLSETRLARFARGRLVVCLAGSAGSEAGNALAVSAPIDAGALAPNATPPIFTVAHRAVGGSGCLGVAPVPGRTDAVHVLYADGSSVVIDASGLASSMNPYFTAPGLDRPPISLEQSIASYTLAVKTAGEVYLRADLTGTSTFGQVYGLPGLSDAPVIANAAKGDERWAFRSTGEIEVVRPDGTVLAVSMTLPRRDRLMGAAFDSKTGEFVLVGFNVKRFFGPPPITAEPWIRRLDPSDPSKLAPVDQMLTRKPMIDNVIFRSIAEVAPGRFVIIGEDKRIFVLYESALEEVAIDWDDPGTAALEPEPAIDSECDFLRLRTESAARDLWRQVAGVPGAAWVVGCSGAVARVLPFASPPRAERVALGRPTQTQYVEGHDVAPLLSALGAVCPDEIYFAGRGESYRDRERGHVWTIRSRAPHETASAEPVFGGMELLDAESNAAAASSVELDSGFPIALSARSGRVIVAFRAGANTRGSAHVVGAQARYRLADGFMTAIEGPNGWSVLGTESGRIVVGTGGRP